MRPLSTIPADIATAIALLTRLPLRVDSAHGARAAWAWPLAGLVPAAAGAAALWAASGIGPGIASALALTATIVVTGALHEDGLADCVDGFWGGWTPERRLAIMRDSRIGAYGVLALVLSLLIRWAALTALVGHGALLALLLAAILSRAAMAPVACLRHARRDGLSVRTGRPTPATAGTAAGIAGIVAIALAGWSGLAILAAAAVAAAIVAGIARAKIGGQTGDVLGATQLVTEIVTLVTMAAIWT